MNSDSSAADDLAWQATSGAAPALGSWSLAAVFAALPSASVLLTPALRIAAVSDAYVVVALRSRAQLLGQQLPGLGAEQVSDKEHEAWPELRASLEQVLATGQPHQVVVPHYGGPCPAPPTNPAERFWQLVNTPVCDAQGAVSGVLHTVEDVTARVQAERAQAALAATQRQQWHLEQLLMQAPFAICTFGGPDWVYELVNPSYQRLFYGRQLLGLPLVKALPEVADQPLMALLHQVYDTGEPCELKEVLVPLARTATGPIEDIYFDLTYRARFDAQQRIDGFVTYAQDVTARVLAQQQHAAQQQQLRVLFEQAPVAIAIFRGPQYVIELANPAVCALWGRTPQQAMHTPLFELLPEAAGQGFEQLLDQVMATGVPYVARELPSFIDRQGRRDTVYWNFVYQPLREGNEQVTAVTVVAAEVTEQVLARQQVQALNEAWQASNVKLSAANQQLTRINQDLDNFIYTASHDLWAPIINIEGLLTALRADLALPPAEAEVPHLLALMQGAVERFKRTIRDLTDVAKLQQAHTQPATPVPVARLVEEVRLDLAPQFAATGGELRLEVAACPTLYFAEKNLRSIVYNLLSNGLKYHHPARPPRLVLRCYPTGNFAVLSVQDNGLGLDVAQQPKVFGLFQRLHDHVEGSGVGLYMVKKIIEQAGGGIELESQVGVGSTFLVYFPQ